MELLKSELQPYFKQRFEKLGKDYPTEFERAYNGAVKQTDDREAIERIVISTLRQLLIAYKPKRKSGRWFKKIGLFLTEIFKK